MSDNDFFVTNMSPSRPADYYIGYLNGCIFLDFNNTAQNKICLKRISFDGYGCCDLTDEVTPLDEEDSNAFKELVQNGIRDQEAIKKIIMKAIQLNKNLIWEDAMKHYNLI